MYLITNRALKKAKGLKVFGKTLSPKGPNELRLVKVSKSKIEWEVEPVTDRLSIERVMSLKSKHDLDIDVNVPWYGSLEVACELFKRARDEEKSILFFIHGYNNDVADVLAAAQELETLYDVIVVPFTWPANGGGAISGTASYLSDKSDARASAGALNRMIGKIHQFHNILTCNQNRKLQKMATKKQPDSPMAAAALYVELLEKSCPVKITILCHSMGNYVFKHTLSTSENTSSHLVFDNICLVAADTNNENHITWVGQLDVRKRVYVVINENDSALKASRIKPGEEQKARLGHYLKKLSSPNAYYIDVTDADHVKSEHTYFKGDSVKENELLKAIFKDMFNGKAVEEKLNYRVDNNTYNFI
jgi:esterase/lipase superfamily enzyme